MKAPKPSPNTGSTIYPRNPRMPKKNPKFKGWSSYPKLHRNVADLLAAENLPFTFNDDDNETDLLDDYDTNIMGRFVCRNEKCSSGGWGSKKIAINVRMYKGQKYNARVYHQRCEVCKTSSRPILDENSYIERVVYRLKKWSGVKMEPPPFESKNGKPPHRRDLCEGCKAGHCIRS